MFAELGVVLLMFSTGIEFSITDEMRVKWVALVGELSFVVVQQVGRSSGMAGENVFGTAIALVILVSLIGFWEWRSAPLMALAIPITLAMNFGVICMLGIDIQQVSIATLIIPLGLLVDDPVVAGDATKNEG